MESYFGGNVTSSCKVFKLQKMVIRIMPGAESKASCRGLVRKLEIFPVPWHYILSLMLFIMDNPNNFQTGLEVRGLHTRSKNQIFTRIENLTNFKKEITYILIYSIEQSPP